MATVFHLIRHGSYPWLGRGLAGRMPGLSLNAEGRAEAERVAERLAGIGLAAVAASPRERTLEAAAPVAARCGLSVTADPGLDEVDFGAWTGRGFADLGDDPAWHAFNRLRGFAPVPGGETMSAVQTRAVAALLRWHAAFPEAEVALVSHGDVIKAMLLHALGAPLDMILRIEIAPASRSVLVLDRLSVQVRALNLPAGA